MCKNYTKPADFHKLEEDKLFYEENGIPDQHRLAMLFAYMVKTANPDEEVNFTMRRPTPSSGIKTSSLDPASIVPTENWNSETTHTEIAEPTGGKLESDYKKKEARYQKALDKHLWHLINRFYEHKADWYVKEVYGELGYYKCLPNHEVKWLEVKDKGARDLWLSLKKPPKLMYRGYKLIPMDFDKCICHQITPVNSVLMYHIPTKNHVIIGNECVARFLENDLSEQLIEYKKHELKKPKVEMMDDAINRGFIRERFDKTGVLPFGFIRYLSEVKAMPSVDLTVEENGRLYRLGFKVIKSKKKEVLFELRDLSQKAKNEKMYREVGKGEKLTLFKDGDLTKVDKEDARKYIYLRGDQTHDNTAI